MPTETFYHLPEEKRNRLTLAIRGEFSRVPFSGVSINRIVHAAGISRGSFYQYFSGRDDLLHFVLDELHGRLSEFLSSAFASAHGDPFAVAMAAYDWVAALGLGPENRALYTNLLANLRVQDPCCLEACARTKDRLLSDFYARVDRRLLADPSDETLSLAVELLQAVIRGAVTALFTHPENAAAIRDRLIKKLTLLQNGLACRQEDRHAR